MRIGGENDRTAFEKRLTGEKGYGDDEIRLFAGKWQGEVKLRVELLPWQVSVGLVKWVTSDAEDEAFKRYLVARKQSVSGSLRRLSGDLEPLGVVVDIRSASRGASTYFDLMDETEWDNWVEDVGGQATAEVRIIPGINIKGAVQIASHKAETEGTSLAEGLARYGLPGPGGHTLMGMKSDQPRLRSPSDTEIQDFVAVLTQLDRSYRETWNRLVVGGEIGGLLLYASSRLAEILSGFRESLEQPDTDRLTSALEALRQFGPAK